MKNIFMIFFFVWSTRRSVCGKLDLMRSENFCGGIDRAATEKS